MKKVKVKICIGTTCFIMGGSDLQNLNEYLPEHLIDKVDIIGSPCINACKNDNYGQAPFVLIDNHLIEKANIEKIITTLESIIVLQEGQNNEP